MTEQEMHDLALNITNQLFEKMGEGASEAFPDDETKAFATAFTRAAVAHGLRLGAKTCEMQAMRWRGTVEKNYVARECMAACAAKADEIEVVK